MNSNHMPLVRNYAMALIETADKLGIVGSIIADFNLVDQCITAGPGVLEQLSSPSIDRLTRHAIIEKAFTGSVHQITTNFLKVIASNGRYMFLEAIIKEFRSIVNKRNNRTEAVVECAHHIDNEQLLLLKEKLELKYKRTFDLSVKVNMSIIAGFTIRFDNILIDMSIAGKLDQLRQKMIKAQYIKVT